MKKIKLGISTCLLGENVRYDGGHKLDRFLTNTLGQYFDYVPVCPEVECGLPVPRESMHLEGNPDSPHLVTSYTKQDMTNRMVRWASKRVAELETEDLCGFIFKSNSPSSGMERIRVYNEKGIAAKKGVGIFARIFMDHFPLLPVEDEGRLHDPELRENFIERIFALKRWREALAKKESRGVVVDFHTKHKLLVLSHSPKHYQAMGKLVAKVKDLPLKELYGQYQTLLMEALKLKTTPKKNSNVLMHMMGYFKEQLSSDEKEELLKVIDHYQEDHIPLIVPITLINHYVRKYNQTYLKQHVYLNPHPLELRLRNHV
ncbi:MAG: YbgA family protein [Thermodesulfobacteriota bacterium]